jgi:hypothetical protein
MFFNSQMILLFKMDLSFFNLDVLNQYIIPILIPLLVAIASGFLSYFGAIQRIRKDLEAEFDRELRAKRIKAYSTLWMHLKLLTHTQIMDLHDVRKEGLLCLYRNLHDWYFESGMFLSTHSRKQFDKLKENMRDFFQKEDLSKFLEKGSFAPSLTNPLLDTSCIEEVKKMGRIKKKIKIRFNVTLPCDPYKKCFEDMNKIEKMIKIGKNFRDSLVNDIGGRREFFT